MLFRSRHFPEGLRVVQYTARLSKVSAGEIIDAGTWALYRREMTFEEYLKGVDKESRLETVVLRHLKAGGGMFSW